MFDRGPTTRLQRSRVRARCGKIIVLVFDDTQWVLFQVQERALKTVPDLCDTIDYAEVQGVLFPRVAVGPHYISRPS
jgi:hypothetical protein